MENTSTESKGKTPTKPPSKREEKCADPDLQNEVDEMMLDYLIHNAIKSVLEKCDSRSPDRKLLEEAERHINMVDSFVSTSNSLRPNATLSASCQTRLSLLRAIILLVQRFDLNPDNPPSTSLIQFKIQNRSRASTWWSHRTGQVSSQLGTGKARQMLFHKTEETASRAKARGFFLRHHNKDMDLDHVRTNSLSLLDLLPTFMVISADSIKRDRVQAYAGPWMEMATELCVVAALEQYILFGAEDDCPPREAFAWGYNDATTSNAADPYRTVNDLFELFKTVESTDWEAMRDQASLMFTDTLEGGFDTTLLNLAQQHPLNETETKVVDYFTRLWQDLEPPILTQLDSGRMQGFSKEETEVMLQKVGWYG